MQPIPLFNCSLGDEALALLRPVFNTGQLASGPAVSQLEQLLEQRGASYGVVAMGNMTHALQLALHLSGVVPGDEVITLSFNCMSSNSAISALGAKAVWADIDPSTAQMDLRSVKRNVGPRTKAVVVYHVAGYPADMSSLRAICDAHGIVLIEDANNAMGAAIDEQAIGSFGDFAVFSFYANRQLNAVEGAALLCRDERMADAARRLRRFGIDNARFRTTNGEIDPQYDIAECGMASALNNVNAVLGLHSLQSLDARMARTRANAAWLEDALSGLPGLNLVRSHPATRPAYWVMLACSSHRDLIQHALRESGIQSTRLHHPNHLYSCFGNQDVKLPGTDLFASRVFAVPCGWWLEAADLQRIAYVIKKCLSV